MKKLKFPRNTAIILITLLLVIFIGCRRGPSLNKVKDVQFGHIQVVEIDSCEYVIWSYSSNSGNIIHKQNCKFCVRRSQNTLTQ